LPVCSGFTLPGDATYSGDTLKTYLDKVLADTIPGDVSLYWADSDKNFINAPGPYWCGKAIYPLAQSIIAADQASLSDYKSQLVSRLKGILTDWFTYSGTSDKRWLYYDQIYGSMYYSADNFSTNSRLSDHHFTSGYLVYGAAVLSMYDSTFASEYGEMAKLLLKDYMNYDQDSRYPSFRGFDTYAGHSWADGFGDFGDDNDQESCGEALNSWNAAYLLGVALGDESMEKAAIWASRTRWKPLNNIGLTTMRITGSLPWRIIPTFLALTGARRTTMRPGLVPIRSSFMASIGYRRANIFRTTL
jgi:endo-1,3(4)-beta-glucanase